MKKPGYLALLTSGVLFTAFFANVALGAFGLKPPLDDVQEMMLLFFSSLMFAGAVLLLEAADRRAPDGVPNGS